MDDLISRQAAIEHLKKRLIETAINNTGLTATCDAVFADMADNRIETWITELPSAQPERKTGRWIDYVRGRWVYAQCSECGTVRDVKSNYCPNCGLPMEE